MGVACVQDLEGQQKLSLFHLIIYKKAGAGRGYIAKSNEGAHCAEERLFIWILKYYI